MIVRPARAADSGPIAALEGDLTTAQIAATLGLPSTIALVAEADGQLVGHVLATAAADQGEISWITVAPAQRRSGIAHALLAALDTAWRAQGVTEAWLEVRPDNTAALGLYHALGWVEHSVRKAYYRDGADALVLHKAIRVAMAATGKAIREAAAATPSHPLSGGRNRKRP